ncbi:MAG: prolyl oligopeptidase family protein [Terriglobales bacterium]
MSYAVFLLLLVAAIALADNASSNPGTNAASTATPAGPPKAKVDVAIDDLHGHKISDPYRWMENGDSPETQEYVRAQLAYTRSLLDPLPGREKIHARLTQLLSIGNVGTPQVGGEWYFYTRREGMQNQPVLYVRKGLKGTDRALVDVNALAADGTVALDWWQISHDGKYVAYGTSPSGSEKSTLHVIETATGKLMPDTIEQTRAASVAWKLDDSGFYYTRYPKKGDVPAEEENYHRRVYYHALGGDVANDPLIFEPKDPQDWPNVSLSNDGRWLTIVSEQGWTKSEIYLKDLRANTPPVTVISGKNFLYSGEVFNGVMYIVTNEDAPHYKVFAARAEAPDQSHWKPVIPESEDAVLQGLDIISGKLVAEYEKNVSSLLKVFSVEGKPLAEVPLPGIGSVAGVGGQWDSQEAFFGFQSFTVPPTILHYDMQSGKTSLFAKVEAPIDSGGYEVEQVWCKSKDGTRVPMFIVSKKGLALAGKNPTLLYGYGGFQVSETPAFSRGVFLWLENGGVYVLANLRGGSEFGEAWHRSGMLEKKQNVFDDFASAAEYLIAQKYTDRDHLAIMGGSNGGLLVGASITQHPDLFRAAVCQVPLLDMLRYQNFLIAKLWVPEYGSSADPKQFEYLYAYSPYHHVKPGTLYPAVLFMTADSDTRVDSMHAKKMAALMQAEAKNGADRDRPILLRIEPKAGHGQGKPLTKQIEESTDIWSFLFWQLGVKP